MIMTSCPQPSIALQCSIIALNTSHSCVTYWNFSNGRNVSGCQLLVVYLDTSLVMEYKKEATVVGAKLHM